MSDYYFRTEQMAVGYQGIPLLREIEIGVDRGEILTLLGANGSGKSTILRSIAGQLQLVAGCVCLNQENIVKIGRNELAKQMAVVFTDRMQTELMTCEDVVASGRYPYTGRFGILSKEDLLVTREAMKMTNVSEISGCDFNKISDGQRQRVLLARALCQQPEIILLDEPVSFLDIRYKLEFLSILQRLAKDKRLSVIMSLHELDLAHRISDMVLCIGDGHVERFGTPEEVFTDGYISQLFRIEKGSFEEGSGDVELEAPQGEPKVFVLAGCGSGRAVYRKLQREGIPFSTGILYRHDVDYPVARALAAEVIAVQGTAPIGEDTFQRAKKLIDSSESVILCRDWFGVWESANEELFCYAKASGKTEECCK